MTEWSPTRRQFLGVTGVGGLASVSEVAPAKSGSVSWKNVTEAVPDHPFVPTADVHWSLDFGDDSARLIDRVNDTFYVQTAGEIRAISADGTSQWQFEVESDHPTVAVGPESAYLAEGYTVYVDDNDAVYALDSDGRVRWRYEEGRHQHVESAIQDLLIISEVAHFGEDDALVGLAASDGSERWRVPSDDRVWLGVRYDGETLYFGTGEGRFYALDPDDGTIHWQFDLSEQDDTSSNESRHLLAVKPTDDRAFAWDSDEGTLYAFEASDGDESWRFESETDTGGFPGTVGDDTVYIGDGTSVFALSTADGSEQWRFDTGSEERFLSYLDGDTIYVGNEDGTYALSTETGRERWQFGTGNFPIGVIENTVVTDAPDSPIYALSTEDGRVRWQYNTDGTLSWFPHIYEEAVYLGTDSGTVTAITEPDSTPVADTLRTVTSPSILAVGGLLGGALTVGAYRRRNQSEGAEPSGPTTFEEFELVEPLSATDDAEVHEARSPEGEQVVLKRLGEDAIASDTFADAVETWADLDHEGILDVREWGTDPVPWVATERADASLADRADDLSTPELVRAVADAAEAVHRAHREGVAHGCLTPENVLVRDGEVRVGDWRLAVELRDSPERYILPESEPDPDPEEADPDPDPEEADTYRLAVLADDLLADEQTGKELETVLDRALAGDPDDRYDSALESDDRYDSALEFADALRWAVRSA